MNTYLELSFIRNVLSKNKFDNELAQLLTNIQIEVASKKHPLYGFMNEMINLAHKEIENKNYKLASYDIDLIHNFPKKDISNWNEEYFYTGELLTYCDRLGELGEINKIKKVIHFTNDYLLNFCI